MSEYITASEAAEILGITRSYVDLLLARGILQGNKITARLWLVERASLANWTPKRKRSKP